MAEKIFTSKGEWAGNCFGMTSSSVIFHAGTTNLQFKDFNSEANYVKDLRITDSNQKVQLTLSQLIEIMQISQFDSKVKRAISSNDNKLDELCRKV